MTYLSTSTIFIGLLGFPMVHSWLHIPEQLIRRCSGICVNIHIGSGHIHNLHVPTTIVIAIDELVENGIESIGNMRGILDSHYLSYFFRQNLYGTVLSESHLLSGIQNTLNTSQLDVFYLGIFTFTIGLFVKDLTYKKKIEKLLNDGILSRRTTRSLEIFIFIVSMVLFKDVNAATGVEFII